MTNRSDLPSFFAGHDKAKEKSSKVLYQGHSEGPIGNGYRACVFIGGPSDGKVEFVVDESNLVVVPVVTTRVGFEPTEMFGHVGFEQYKRLGDFAAFYHMDLTESQVVVILVAKYAGGIG